MMNKDDWGADPIDDMREIKRTPGRTPRGVRPPSQAFNRIVRTANETRAFEKRVARRRDKKRKRS